MPEITDLIADLHKIHTTELGFLRKIHRLPHNPSVNLSISLSISSKSL